MSDLSEPGLGVSSSAARNQSHLWEPEERDPWRNEAACIGVDPDTFFPTRGELANRAKGVCAGCTVKAECLDYAMRNHITDGIWGGLSERQRRTIRPGYKRMAPCELCGTRYDYIHPGQRYCSDDCRREAHRRVNVAYSARTR